MASEFIEFYSAHECGYAQRTWVALLEKKIPFNMTVVPLRHPVEPRQLRLDEKPAWFLALNPHGKVCWRHACVSSTRVLTSVRAQVPVITYRGTAIYESSIINEFLEEQFPDQGASLLPKSATQRALARIAIDFCTFTLIPAFYRLLINKGNVSAHSAQLLTILRELDSRLRAASATGPYWFGEQFTLVDIAFVPFVDRCVTHQSCSAHRSHSHAFSQTQGPDALSRFHCPRG